MPRDIGKWLEGQGLAQHATAFAESDIEFELLPELRAATALARLWNDQGKTDDARDLRAPLFGWFAEGFETRDLKEAKALLDEIS
jgi:predicted ATPase